MIVPAPDRKPERFGQVHRVVNRRAVLPGRAGGFAESSAEVEDRDLYLHQPLRPGDNERGSLVFDAPEDADEPVDRTGRAAGAEDEVRGHDDHDGIAAVVDGGVPGVQGRRCRCRRARQLVRLQNPRVRQKRGQPRYDDKKEGQPAVRARQDQQVVLVDIGADPAVIETPLPRPAARPGLRTR